MSFANRKPSKDFQQETFQRVAHQSLDLAVRDLGPSFQDGIVKVKHAPPCLNRRFEFVVQESTSDLGQAPVALLAFL